MMSRFFVDRPVFTMVLAIFIALIGFTALSVLPIEQYPNIMPPQITVSASYTGADALTVSQNVAAPLEQAINGVENMMYMYSQNGSSGDMNMSVFFNIGSDADMAQINVQNRVNMALPRLPEEVQRTGVLIKKQTPTILLLVAIQSPDGRYDDIYVNNYASIYVVDELLRVPGISDAKIIGSTDYSMRIWLKPDRLAQLGLTATDVITAIREQNVQYGIGQIGQAPMENPVELTLSFRTKGRFSDPNEFERIILKANPDGSNVLLKDVGRVELGALSYDVINDVNGKSAALIAVFQQYGANALGVAEDVKKTLERLSKSFPSGLTYSIPYDTTKFIKASIHEVFITLIEAAILVIIVVFIFLQRFTTTLIPILAMCISIIGTFAGMYALGFSLNTLTMFGLVLAIGIVVDDAIVVIENVERNMRENKMSPYEATIETMREVTGPVISTTIVLCAVFLPVAFLGGLAGQLYKQFAITIAISVIISMVMALTLSPMMAAMLLKPIEHSSKWGSYFNKGLSWITDHYIRAAQWMIKHYVMGLALFVITLGLLGWLVLTVPTALVPQEDQGYLFVLTNSPDGASLDRTDKVDKKIEEVAVQIPGVEDVVSLTGFSFVEGVIRPVSGSNFITLKDWSQRKTPQLQANAILMRLYGQYKDIPQAQIIPFNPPAIQGMGTVGGFEFWIENRGDYSISDLQEITQKFIARAQARPEVQAVTTFMQADNMQLYVDLDRYKAKSLGVPISDVFQTLQILLGSFYVNDFNKFGRVFRVTAQAEPSYRKTIADIGDVFVRSDKGVMVPLKSLVTIQYAKGPNIVSRFNGFTAARVFGNSAPGYSSGQAMQAMEEVAQEVLPQGMTYSWSGESYQQKVTGGTSYIVLLASLVMVFLILSALYESWSLPLAILLGVPFGLIGAFACVMVRGMPNDIYFQIGLVTLIALAAKNAILIVEFAAMKRKEGATIYDAAVEAGRLRFRAIQMTSLTFIFGVWPLVVSAGAGAASRHSVGTGVFGGMISATVLGVFFIPLFYYLIATLANSKKGKVV